MAHSPRPRASLRGASALQKCRCPAQFSCLAPLSPLSAEACGCNPVFAGAGAFPATRGMFKRPSAALPAGGEPSEGAVFFAELPRRSDVCAGRRFSAPARSAGNRETSRPAVLQWLYAGRSLSVFPCRGLPRRRAAHPSRKGRSAAIFGTGRAGSLRNRRAATAPARDGAFCVETSRRLLCAALSPPAWDARAEDGAFARRRSPARGIRRSDGRPQSDAKTTRDWEAAPARSQRRAMFFLLRCGTRTAITRFPSSAWEEGSAASLGPRRRRNEGSNAPRTRRGRAGRPRSSAQVVRGRFVTDGQPRLRRGTGRSALKLPGDCSALP